MPPAHPNADWPPLNSAHSAPAPRWRAREHKGGEGVKSGGLTTLSAKDKRMGGGMRGKKR